MALGLQSIQKRLKIFSVFGSMIILARKKKLSSLSMWGCHLGDLEIQK